MYNSKDIQFVGKHDFDKESAITDAGWNKTFSVGVFQWEMKNNGMKMKKGKAKVRVSGPVEKKDEVFASAEMVVNLLDSGRWGGKKSVTVK